MEDIDEVIKQSRHLKYVDPLGECILNSLSSLPSSKKHLKQSIIERINLLKAAYVSLATFVDDEHVEFLIKNKSTKSKEKMKKISRIYKKVINDTEKLKKEVDL